MLCDRCGVEMENGKVKFSYLGNEFEETMPKCPKCGQVFIPEDIVMGKMARVEEEFEEK